MLIHLFSNIFFLNPLIFWNLLDIHIHYIFLFLFRFGFDLINTILNCWTSWFYWRFDVIFEVRRIEKRWNDSKLSKSCKCLLYISADILSPTIAYLKNILLIRSFYESSSENGGMFTRRLPEPLKLFGLKFMHILYLYQEMMIDQNIYLSQTLNLI